MCVFCIINPYYSTNPRISIPVSRNITYIIAIMYGYGGPGMADNASCSKDISRIYVSRIMAIRYDCMRIVIKKVRWTTTKTHNTSNSGIIIISKINNFTTIITMINYAWIVIYRNRNTVSAYPIRISNNTSDTDTISFNGGRWKVTC